MRFESYKSCCCDECCGNVETFANCAMPSVYPEIFQVVICENLGKLLTSIGVRADFTFSIHRIQHKIRTFHKASPQRWSHAPHVSACPRILHHEGFVPCGGFDLATVAHPSGGLSSGSNLCPTGVTLQSCGWSGAR